MWQNCKTTLTEIRRALLLLGSLLILSSGLTPLLNGGTASAVAVTQRSLTITTGIASATATYTFAFTPGSTTQIQSMIFQACTTALGTCTAPTGINLSGGAITKSGTWGGATNFTKDTTTNPTVGTPAVNCTTVSILCLTRTDTTVQTLVAHSIIDTGAVNQNSSNCGSAANCTFFVRVFSYSDTAYTTAVDNGTVASSTTQTLLVNFAIQEQLTFCIGTTTIDDGTTAPPACASVSGTSLNLGTASSGNVSVSPVTVGNGGDGNNGIAELSTNAANGATVTYDAVQAGSGTNHLGTLRVTGASCNAGNINTDQCINAIGTTQATLTAGTEAYGMTIAAVDCSSAPAYTCTFAGGTYHLTRNANYDGTGGKTYPTDTNLVSGTTNAGYAWDETGTAQTIASSTSPNGSVDREALILKFAATPNIVTPTGAYSVKGDFVATPTF
jgi:hypothetical protein